VIPFGCGRCGQYAAGWRYDPAERAHVHPDGRVISDLDLDQSDSLRADFQSCRECTKRKVDFLTMEEAFEVFGHAQSTCYACKLTNKPRSIPSAASVSV
jgi:hypothetical protein